MNDRETLRHVITVPSEIEESPHAIERRAEKAEARLGKFQIDIFVYNELLLDDGMSIDAIDQKASSLLEVFRLSPLVRQQELAHKLRKQINLILTRRLNSSLVLTHALKTEDGVNSSAISKDEQEWKELFHNCTSPDRLEIVRSIEKLTEDMLMGNFGEYLEEWKRILATDPTMSPEAVRQEIVKQRQRFEHASRRGKIGLSRHLRETIDASSMANFSALLALYEELLRKNAYNIADLPAPEVWVEEYSNASIPRRKGIINRLHSNIIVLMTPTPPKESPKTE
ncbi:MAG TPA: hypothetical protein VMR77_02900 [Patescibacteria group bacterium]|jgi:hypothetical protein|nr:hypothetical protein [Patescibacteria group bacterium]